MVWKWCDTACFSCFATGKDHRNQSGSVGLGQHFLQTTPRCTQGFKKRGKQSTGKSKGAWNTKLHVVSANDKVIVEMHLSGGNCHDAPQGRISIEHIGERYPGVPILMDKAYEGDKTRELCRLFGHDSVVPPKKNWINPWEYDHEWYKKRNIIESINEHFQRLAQKYVIISHDNPVFNCRESINGWELLCKMTVYAHL